VAEETRFGRPSDDPDETVERLAGELQDARERVFRLYVDVRERGVGLVESEQDGDNVAA
jgi:hypothetical protein